jgi:hypothetical protein
VSLEKPTSMPRRLAGNKLSCERATTPNVSAIFPVGRLFRASPYGAVVLANAIAKTSVSELTG